MCAGATRAGPHPMSDFTVRADSVNVEQIMDQIRARIREKRGVDYTEQQIQEMATAKLEKFLDPRGVRSDLLERFRAARPVYTPPELPNYAFEEETLFDSHRGALRSIRRLLRPILKLFLNPGPLIQALNIQSRLNTMSAEREARRETARHAMDQLSYEVMHNLVVELTRTSIEVKNLKMRVESLTSRLEFAERRARALESVVMYAPQTQEGEVDRPATPPPVVSDEVGQPPTPSGARAPGGPAGEGPGQRSRRRRRRRGRRGGASAVAVMANLAPGQADAAPNPQLDEQAGDEGSDNDHADHRANEDTANVVTAEADDPRASTSAVEGANPPTRPAEPDHS
jgi:hypothetical protein